MPMEIYQESEVGSSRDDDQDKPQYGSPDLKFSKGLLVVICRFESSKGDGCFDALERFSTAFARYYSPGHDTVMRRQHGIEENVKADESNCSSSR